MAHFEREYSYEDGRTTAVLEGADMAITLRPSRAPGFAYEVGFFPNDGERGLVALMTPGGLRELIADLQRLGGGCFDQEWPRPSEAWHEFVREVSMAKHPSSQGQFNGLSDIHDDLTFDDLLGDPLPAPKKGPLETVAELIGYLEENFSADSPLRNVSVDADECVIRIG